MNADLSRIHAVLERYYDGLYHCDVPKLRSVFHPQAHYSAITKDGFSHLDMKEYFAILENRYSPAARGDEYFYHIEMVGFAGPATAQARLTCTMLGNLYTDLLSLLLFDEQWQIIAKVFHTEKIPHRGNI